MSFEKLRQAVKDVKNMEYNSNMVTDSKEFESEDGQFKVFKKCGDLDNPTRIVFQIEPNYDIGHSEPNITVIKSSIEQITNISNTDINVVPKSLYQVDNGYSIVIPEKLFN
jgi:hypothetical protein